MGLMKGVSDLIILLPNATALFFECKTEIGFQSRTQKAFQEDIESLGFTYCLFRSEKQFWELLTPHLIEAGLEVKNG